MKMIGVERERFIVDPESKQIVSSIDVLLPAVQQVAEQNGASREQFTYELFAGQVEDKTPPCDSLEAVSRELNRNEEILIRAASELGLSYDHSEFVQAHQIDCLTVNPFSDRHQGIWVNLPPATRLAASAVAAVHIHIEVDQTTAVRVLNHCREETVERLIAMGDHTGGFRIASYRQMAGVTGVPPYFASYQAVQEYINGKGGEKNVWDLVRYKPSTQTIEFRMFGSTPSIPEIISYAQACLEVVE